MIKTLVYTTEFIQNLSKYRNKLSPAVNLPVETAPPPPPPQAAPIPPISPPALAPVQLETIKPDPPYKPQFKSVDTDIAYKKIKSDTSNVPIAFSRTERSIYIRPDLSEEIHQAETRVISEMNKQGKILEKERIAIETVQQGHKNFQNIVLGRGAGKRYAFCENERLELMKCLSSGGACLSQTTNLEKCLANN